MLLRRILPRTLAAPLRRPAQGNLSSRMQPCVARLPITRRHQLWTYVGPPKATLDSASGSITFTYKDETKQNRLPNIWLRDNCRCSSCVNRDTRQRAFNTFDIPQDIRPESIETSDRGLTVIWANDSHMSFYPWGFIKFWLSNTSRGNERIHRRFWGSDGPEQEGQTPAWIDFADVKNAEKGTRTEGLARLTNSIRINGLVFVKGVPAEDGTATQSLLEKIAFIRHTHYGGFYDFTPNMAMADTAYTNIALAAHTDNTYFTDPSGLQAFHMLSHVDPNAREGDELGGKTLLVDGFFAAHQLRQEDKGAWETLSKTGLSWHASGNEGIAIAPDKLYPVLETRAEGKKLHRIRWNNDDRGVVPLFQHNSEEWYRAARKWDEILKRKSVEYWFQLEPGTVLIFDNWRVLHGRSAFTGIRRMCGGYINRDDFISTWRLQNYGRKKTLDTIIG